MPPRAALLLTMLAVGCGGESTAAKRPTGTLKGKLTVAGSPFPAKTGLVFQNVETGRLFLATTDESGAFTVDKPEANLPIGRYDVSVQPKSATDDQKEEDIEAALEGPKGGKSAAPSIQIPQKYRNSHESGLGFELQPGPNERTIDLKL